MKRIKAFSMGLRSAETLVRAAAMVKQFECRRDLGMVVMKLKVDLGNIGLGLAAITGRSSTMRKILCLTSAMVLLAGCAATMDKKMAAKSGAHTHMGHVTTGWKDTPGRKGLLPTAIIEAKITQKHAGFASNKMGNLAWMKTHIGHVLHTIDPGVERKGPGLGYGVVKAAGGARKHVGFAAADKSASKNVKTHAKHVKASTKNVVTWSKLIVRLGKKVKKAKSAAQAAPMVKKIKQLAARLTKGDDANGDGKVSWGPGEGGLDSATQHMGFMKKGEGL